METETSRTVLGGATVLELEEAEGRRVLGFDTGLDPVAFAQAKLAQLLTEEGFIVAEGGAISSWRAEGVAEREGRMIIWGPAFEGERFDRIIDRGGDEALDALRSWAAARGALAESNLKTAIPDPYPAGAFVGKDGAIFFAPERLGLRSLDAGSGDDRLRGADRWTHPDLTAAEAESFVAGALAYRLFAGSPPFDAADADSMRADMRDGRCLPIRVARPGLDEELALLIDAAIASGTPHTAKRRGGRTAAPRSGPERPSLSELAEALGSVGSMGIDGFVRALTEEETAAAEAARSRRLRSSEARIGRKRFVRRNATIIAAVSVAVVVLGLVARSIIVGRSELPTTAGMSPRQVAEAYYGSFGKLDHALMEACVVDKAGAGDINATMNLFVISRVREAYERQGTFMSAADWIAQGSAPVAATVYGVVDLSVEETALDEAVGTATLRARYVLWMPSSGGETAPEEKNAGGAAAQASSSAGNESGAPIPMEAGQSAAPPPVAERREDTLTLLRSKGLWHIAKIDRKVIE